jgi:hypothetical protein
LPTLRGSAQFHEIAAVERFQRDWNEKAVLKTL